jgi:hypothetical protein
MNNAKPTIITGKNRTYSTKSLTNPYRDIEDYYINTSQRDRIRNKKIKSSNNLPKKPVTLRRYNSRERMRKPSTHKKPKKPKKPVKSAKPKKPVRNNIQ